MAGNVKHESENPQIRAIREEIDALVANPDFAKMSAAFRESVSKRLGLAAGQLSGTQVEARIPLTLKQILQTIDVSSAAGQQAAASLCIPLADLVRAANVASLEQLKAMDKLEVDLGVLRAAPPPQTTLPDGAYYNIYRYSFW
jgi:hypothetical protein